MDRIVEIRTYKLKPGTRGDFERLFLDQARPMLTRWGVDMVGYGRSLDDEDSFYLMRCYPSLEDRRLSQDAFYGSDEWLQGPRAGILACIENYITVVVSLDDEAVEALRRAHGGEGSHPSSDT
jgi:hypothetical protein